MSMKKSMESMKRQRGAVLIVALVILLVVTALGAAAMRSATLEMRMASNSQERQQAFDAAEAALRNAEAWLDLNGHISQAKVGCTGNGCYSNTCTGGRCWFGEWPNPQHDQCDRTPATLPSQQVWADSTLEVWSTATRHVVVDLDGIDDANDPRYIIEFQCFIEDFGGCDLNIDGDCPAMYRITALGQSNSGRVKTLLQSVYRVNL